MRRVTRVSIVLCLGLLVSSCAGKPPSGTPDAGLPVDAAVFDADAHEAGPDDSGPIDATIELDAGEVLDAAIELDAGDVLDAGVEFDAGDVVDSGVVLIDAGASDASTIWTGDAEVHGPSPCNRCHGDLDSSAPPRALRGILPTTARGVGAHRSHLGASGWHREIACTDCHLVPATIDSVGHIDTPPPAELTWSALATADTAAPAFDGVTCAGAYCHGATLLPGGSNTAPTWTTVDGTQAACGTCHGLPPGGSHPAGTTCSTCHPTMNGAGDIIDPARHIDGVVDVATMTCTSCHGDVATGPAPPSDTTGGTATSARGVGAHASHLGSSTWRRAIDCAECHSVPTTVDEAGHVDTALPAELTWGPLASADTASPAFDGATCSGSYCHGSTLLPGGSNTTPRWTTVDGTQSDCGTCHGLPPGGTHPSGGTCSTCHPTMNAAGTIIAPERHIDGVVDVVAMTCTSCHGDVATGPAPPSDTTGATATTARGVGAHASHLGTSTWRHDIACTECHDVPVTVGAAGHIDSTLPAELVWGALATADTASPTFDGTRCSGSYCHGGTLLPGGSNTAPAWTTVDGTQSDCGTCHGLPPGGTHPSSGNCSTCHPTMNAAGTIIDPARHIDGVVDVVAMTCTTCHGDVATGPAPPRDTTGGTSTTVRGVGAHAAHLGTSTWRRGITCEECHKVPVATGDAGHVDTALPAELTWGLLASADTASPTFDGATCTGSYCHGATLLPGGTDTTPTWTRVDGSQDACGTCHGLPPGGTHPSGGTCSTCHPTMNAAGTIIAPDRHIDGVVDVVSMTCTSCHGDPATGPAPPLDTTGGTATTRRGVGAHASHLRASTWRHDISCTACHDVPTAVGDVGHVDTALPAELTWGALAIADAASPTFNGTTCSGAYCHGATLMTGGTDTTPTWARVDGTQAACGTCHGLPPGGTHPVGGTCSTCHPTMNAAGTITDPARHIDGVVDVRSLTCTSCHGALATGSAPPLDTTGGTATTRRGVGAHASHLRSSTWRHDIACTDCHKVPAVLGDVGHVDTALPAELTWGALARADAASPAFSGTTCTGAYCHGATLMTGGTDTTPNWTTVNGTQAACGTCHGLPPGGTHPVGGTCSTCHPTMNAAGTIIAPSRHIDGVVDVVSMSCTSCHGALATGPAPPLDTTGGTATTLRGVGAHASHLRASTWRHDVVCTDCHKVPAAVGDVGHVDTALPAELTWGTLARSDTATPAFNGTTCSGAYCHGATLMTGGTDTTPTWARVDGTQAACGTCHGLPPGGAHPVGGTCSTCHPTMNAAGTITDPARHIDGVVDVRALTCTSCHGAVATGAAPPLDTTGGTATTRRGVGAHASHLRTSTWRRAIDCAECHVVPATMTSAGHIDTALPAELSWGPIARADAASPAFSGTTCTGAYCHGATLMTGGTDTTPTWTTVNGTQAACGTCHGLPPGGTHPASPNCSTCHPTMNAAGAITDAARHIDGVVDVLPMTCTSCHGASATGPAPPLDTTGGTATTRRGVGAHASHLRASTWRRDIACSECHRVPATTAEAGHIDTALPAELTWGPIAAADAASPTFNGTTCSGAYCHGATLMTGGSDTTPNWATVNGTQAACGTCHGLPPGGTHPSSGLCSTCHPTMNAAGDITAPARHIDGVVDVRPMTCTSCHGATAAGPAPPVDTTGGTSTTARGVGAHAAHLATSTWRRQFLCNECHTVPATVGDVGHVDTALPAELTWGPIARADAASPAFTGTTCTGSYCHGATLLPGGSNTTPTWTTVNGTQDACGTCHGLPPGGTHPSGGNCSVCHPTMNAAGTITDPNRHIDGIVDVRSMTCTGCHGAVATGSAPPVDTAGGTATTLRGVGAHASHTRTSTWRRTIACAECHVVPAAVDSAGHIDTALPAELTFSSVAVADAASPTFNGTTCNGAYCHGATLMTGGTDTTPTWTTVNGTQAACGTCHGLPPGGTHPTETNCNMCHSTVISAAGAITAPALHVNGIVDRTNYHPAGFAAATSHGRTFNAGVPSACTSCHGATLTGGTVGVSCESCHPGWQTNCTFCHGNRTTGAANPAEGVNGQTSRLDITVGAHAEHVSATPLHIAWNCTFCHGPTTPTSVFSAGHLDGDSQAETVFGPILGAGTTYNATTGVCGNTYCHGTGTVRKVAPAWNTNPTLTCGSCHAPFTGATAAQLRAMGGEHEKHVSGEGFLCNRCHGTSVSATGTITNVAQHVNGVVEVSVPGFSATACGGTGGCSASGAGCHGDATIWCW